MIKKFIVSNKEWRNFSKAYKSGIIVGAISSVIGTIFAIFILWGIMVGSINFFIFNGYDHVEQAKESAYNRASEKWEQHEFVKSVSYLCSLKGTEIEKINCTVDYVNSTTGFNYTTHGYETNKLRYSPEEIVKKGGSCRDYSVLYSSIFKRLNISHQIERYPGHLNIITYPEDYEFCVVDINQTFCRKKENNNNIGDITFSEKN